MSPTRHFLFQNQYHIYEHIIILRTQSLNNNKNTF